MRVAMVTPVFPPYRSGISQVAWQESVLLAKRGYDVTVFTPRYEWNQSREEMLDGLRVRRVRPRAQYGNAAWLTGCAEELDGFDLAHLHFPFIGGAGEILRAKKKYHWPLIVTYHMDLLSGGWKGTFFAVYQALILPKLVESSDKILVSTLDYAKASRLAKFLERSPEKFAEVPFGVDTDRFRPAGSDDGAELRDLRRELGLEEKEKMVLFVGGLDKAHAFKGVEILLQAWPQIKNAKLVIVGDGERRQEMEIRIKIGGISDSVRFVGRVDTEKLVRYYQLCDVSVLPSVNGSEAYGMVLLEAMACGKPVVASDLPGVRSQVGQDRGLLFPAGNSVEMSESLNKILADDEDRKRIGENARQWVVCHRTLNQEMDLLEAVYNSLALPSKI